MNYIIIIIMVVPTNLVHFDVAIDVCDKFQWGKEWDCPHHEEEDVTGKDGVTKILHCL